MQKKKKKKNKKKKKKKKKKKEKIGKGTNFSSRTRLFSFGTGLLDDSGAAV